MSWYDIIKESQYNYDVSPDFSNLPSNEQNAVLSDLHKALEDAWYTSGEIENLRITAYTSGVEIAPTHEQPGESPEITEFDIEPPIIEQVVD